MEFDAIRKKGLGSTSDLTIVNEVWLPIFGFEAYEVSNEGRVRSWKGKTEPRPHQLKLVLSKCGSYPQVDLSNSGRRKTRKVHRLVAEAFIPNPDGKPEVAHINGNPADNRASNLRWSTRVENNNDRIAHGRWGFKIDEASVKEIINLHSRGGVSQRLIAIQYGISTSSVCAIVNRQTWTHA